MKNQIGKKNMVFGFAYFITTLVLGLYLAFKLKNDGQSWENNPIREILATSHVHGNLEAVLNILSGYILCQLEANTGLLKTISTLLLIGAIFHSGMLYLAGLGVSAAINLAPIGAFSLIASVALMAYSVAVGFKK